MADNSHFFTAHEYQPKCAITLGIANILEARRVVLLATGDNKARAVKAMIEGPLTSMCPASVLQMHPHAVVIIDRGASAHLTQKEYYQHVENMSLELNMATENTHAH